MQFQVRHFWCRLLQQKKVKSLTVALSRRLQSPKLDLSDGAHCEYDDVVLLYEYNLHELQARPSV